MSVEGGRKGNRAREGERPPPQCTSSLFSEIKLASKVGGKGREGRKGREVGGEGRGSLSVFPCFQA